MDLRRLNLLLGEQTARRIAGRLGISGSELSRYRRGQRTPRLATFRALCQALDVSADWLLGLDRDEFHGKPPEVVLSPKQQRILDQAARDLQRLVKETTGRSGSADI